MVPVMLLQYATNSCLSINLDKKICEQIFPGLIDGCDSPETDPVKKKIQENPLIHFTS